MSTSHKLFLNTPWRMVKTDRGKFGCPYDRIFCQPRLLTLNFIQGTNSLYQRLCLSQPYFISGLSHHGIRSVYIQFSAIVYIHWLNFVISKLTSISMRRGGHVEKGIATKSSQVRIPAPLVILVAYNGLLRPGLLFDLTY